MIGLALLALVLVLLQLLPITRQAPLRAAARNGVPLAQQVVWTYDPGLVGQSAPVVLGNRLVFNTLDGMLVALDTKSGDMRWHKENAAASFGAPGAGAGLVFVGNAGGSVFCLDPENGTKRWQQQLLGAVQHAPIRNNSQLIVTTAQGYVHVLHTGSGEIMWGRRLADNLYVAAIGAGSVFVSAGSELFALDRNSGITVWHYQANANITTPPVVAGDLVLVGTETGVLHVLRASDGQPQWQYQARSAISAAPVVRDDTIIIADQSGRGLLRSAPEDTKRETR